MTSKTVAEAGWAGVKNGDLLRFAADQFDVLLTVDRNLEYQQSFAELKVAVIVIHTRSNDIADLKAARAGKRNPESQGGNGDAY